jgi:hypothetical protein
LTLDLLPAQKLRDFLGAGQIGATHGSD